MDLNGNSIMKNRKGLFLTILIIFTLFYIVTIGIQTVSHNVSLDLVLTMFVLVLCVSINILLSSTGLIVSFIFNMIQAISSVYSLVTDGDEYYLYILVATISTAIVDIIIQIYISQIHTRLFAYKQLYSTARSTLIARQEEDSVISESLSRTSLIVKNDRSTAIGTDTSSVLLHSNYIDSLTTLPNRAKIVERIETLIDESIAYGQKHDTAPLPIHIIYIGINNFSGLNEELGHRITDLFIQSVAHRIRETADSEDLVGRLAGFEFVVVSNRRMDENALRKYVSVLGTSINKAFTSDKGQAFLNYSVGIASYPKNGFFSGDLLKHAERAMYSSQEAGENKITMAHNELPVPEVFTNRSLEETRKLFQLAFENNEIYMVYQPQFSRKKKLTGFEALLRWNSDRFGVMTARQFIDAADRTGFIYELGRMCIAQALDTLKKINEKRPDLDMTINFSGLQLKNEDIGGILKKEIERTGCNVSNINIDIPEECLNSPDRVMAALTNISDLGISMSLDNFGRGYSSLNNIPLLPISAVKIDGWFTDDLCKNESKRAITASIVKLLHEIDIKVCATGVEDSDHLNMLINYGCDLFQGKYLNAPVKSSDVLTLVEANF